MAHYPAKIIDQAASPGRVPRHETRNSPLRVRRRPLAAHRIQVQIDRAGPLGERRMGGRPGQDRGAQAVKRAQFEDVGRREECQFVELQGILAPQPARNDPAAAIAQLNEHAIGKWALCDRVTCGINPHFRKVARRQAGWGATAELAGQQTDFRMSVHRPGNATAERRRPAACRDRTRQAGR